MSRQIREVIKRNKKIEPYQQPYLFESLKRANTDCGYDIDVIEEVCETIHLFLKRQQYETLPTSAISEMVITVLESRDMENLKRAYQSFQRKRLNLYSDVLIHNLDNHTPPTLFSKTRLLDSLQRVWGVSKARARDFEHWIEEQLICLKMMVVTNRLIRSLVENKCFSEGQRANFELGQKIGFHQMDLEQEIFFSPKPPDQLSLHLGKSILESFQKRDLLGLDAKELLRNEHLQIIPRSPLKWVSNYLDQGDLELFEYSEQFSIWDVSKLGPAPVNPPIKILLVNGVPEVEALGSYELVSFDKIPTEPLPLHFCFLPWAGHLVQESQIRLNSLKGILLLDDLNKRLDSASSLQVKKWKFLNTLGASHQFNSKETVYARWIHQPSYCQIRLISTLDETAEQLQEILDLTLLKIQSFQDSYKITYRMVLELGETELEFTPLKEKTELVPILNAVHLWETEQIPPSWTFSHFLSLSSLGLTRIKSKSPFFQLIQDQAETV